MARVLIIGASRGIGFESVKQALACGHQVCAFARGANRIKITNANLVKYNGDALNSDDLSAALADVEVVIQALGVSAGAKMVFGPFRLFSQATRALIPAMEKAGVRRLICVTGFGAGDSRGKLGCLQGLGFRMFLGRAYDDKDVQERLIQASDLDWIIVRPVILTNGPWSGRYQVLVDPEDWRNGLISRADVADFLVRQIDDDTYLGKTPVLTY